MSSLRFNSMAGICRLCRYQKGKTNVDFTEARDSECQCHQMGYMKVCTLLQTDNHASTPPFSFTGQMPFLPPNQRRKALKAHRPSRQMVQSLGLLFTVTVRVITVSRRFGLLLLWWRGLSVCVCVCMYVCWSLLLTLKKRINRRDAVCSAEMFLSTSIVRGGVE